MDVDLLCELWPRENRDSAAKNCEIKGMHACCYFLYFFFASCSKIIFTQAPISEVLKRRVFCSSFNPFFRDAGVSSLAYLAAYSGELV
jgi:hypothetical protein